MKQWGDKLAALSGREQYYLYYGDCDFHSAPILINKISLLQHTNYECHDVDLLDDIYYVVVCSDENNYYLQYVSIDGTIEEISYPIQQGLVIEKIQINVVDSSVLVIFIGEYSIIDLYYQRQSGVQLNTQTISELLEIQLNKFTIVDITTNANQIIISDQNNNLIYLGITYEENQVKFTLLKLLQLQYQIYKLGSYVDTNQMLNVLGLIRSDRIVFIELNWEIQLDFELSLYETILQTSQNYLSIYDGFQLIIYKICEKLKILMFAEEISIYYYLFNPYLNDFIIVSEFSISRYVISDGYLILIPPQEIITQPKAFSIVASSGKQECESRVSYIVTSSIDSKLIKPYTFPDPFPNILFFPRIPSVYSMNQVTISGPNQQLKVEVIKNDWQQLSVLGDYKKQIAFIGYDQNYTKLVMSHYETNQVNNSQLFILTQYYQGTNLETNFSICEFNKMIVEVHCISTFKMSELLLLTQDQIQYRYDHERSDVYMFLVQNQDVDIYKVHLDILLLQRQFRQPHNQNILQIALLNQCLIILTDQLIIIQNMVTYPQELFTNNDIHFIINSQFLSQQNYFHEFSPTDIEVNSLWNLIFIVNFQDILILQCYLTCSLVNVLTLEGAMSLRIEILQEKSLIIMAEIESEVQIQEYLIKDPHYIEYQKTYQNYHFQLTRPITFFKNQRDYTFYIQAYSPLLRQIVVLAYQTLSELRNSLITVFKTEEESQNPIVSIAGVDQKYIFISNGQLHLHFLFTNYLQATIIIQQRFDSFFIHNLEIESKFYNVDYPLEQKYRQTIKVVDLQTIIYPVSKILVFPIHNDILIPINSFFQGMVANYFMDEQEHVEIIQAIEVLNQTHQFQSTIIDQCNIDFISVVLTEKSIDFLYTNFQPFQSSIDITDLNADIGKLSCSSLTSKLIAFRYYNQMGQFLLFIQCNDLIKCQKYGSPVLVKDIDFIYEMLIIDQYLVTLSAENKYQQTLLSLFEIIKNDQITILRYADKIDKQKANQDFIIINLNAQCYQVNGVIVFKLFLTETQNGLLYLDLTQEKQLKFSTSVINLNIQSLISSNGLFEVQNQYYSQVVFTQEPKNYHLEGYTEFYLLISTKNSLHYGLIIQFKGQKLLDRNISYLLHSHHLWPMNSYVKVQQNYVAMVYDMPSGETRLLCVYDLPKENQNNLQECPVLIHGSVEIQLPYQQELIVYFQEQDEQILLFYNQQAQQLHQALVHDTPYLNISKKVTDQEFELKAFNFYFEASITISLKSKASEGEITLTVKKLNQYYQLALIVLLGILLCLGLIGYFFFKLRSRNQVINAVVLLE